jgi:hypothetical protein
MDDLQTDPAEDDAAVGRLGLEVNARAQHVTRPVGVEDALVQADIAVGHEPSISRVRHGNSDVRPLADEIDAAVTVEMRGHEDSARGTEVDREFTKLAGGDRFGVVDDDALLGRWRPDGGLAQGKQRDDRCE